MDVRRVFVSVSQEEEKTPLFSHITCTSACMRSKGETGARRGERDETMKAARCRALNEMTGARSTKKRTTNGKEQTGSKNQRGRRRRRRKMNRKETRGLRDLFAERRPCKRKGSINLRHRQRMSLTAAHVHRFCG